MTFAHYLVALHGLYAPNRQELRLHPAASDAELDDLQCQLPFSMDPALRALWQQANGSGRAAGLLE